MENATVFLTLKFSSPGFPVSPTVTVQGYERPCEGSSGFRVELDRQTVLGTGMMLL